MTKGEIIRFLTLRTIGNFFILATIFGFAATFGPAVYYEVNFRAAQFTGVTYSPPKEEPDGPSGFGEFLARRRGTLESAGAPRLFGAIISGERDQVLVPKSTAFSVMIPKIGANEVVVENVDPSNKDEYTRVLSRAVAHAKGSAFPGLAGTTYLFAHSADSFWNVGRYNAVFYLLKELTPGDEIVVFYENRRYNYYVEKQVIVDPEEVSYIDANLGEGEQLILQTCWPPGTTFKRLLVFAKPRI